MKNQHIGQRVTLIRYFPYNGLTGTIVASTSKKSWEYVNSDVAFTVRLDTPVGHTSLVAPFRHDYHKPQCIFIN